MRKLKWNRKLSILVLIMFITVSFASFNTNLFINGNAYVRVDRDIRITNIHLLETEYNGYENTNSEYTNRTISTDVSLPRQASSLTYEVTISNVSDKRYKITDIIEDSYDNPDVKYELLDASIGNIVEPHTTKTFRVKFTNNTTVVEEDDVYQTLTYTFNYTGREQEFVAPYDGTYTLEVWGASGGSYNETYHGGYGAYSKGSINLRKNQLIYVNVGGSGQMFGKGTTVHKGGYNGGGSAKSTDVNVYVGTGGGATHISTKKGLLSTLKNYKDNILVVAGGGGGSVYYYSTVDNNYMSIAGSGGGTSGSNSEIQNSNNYTFYDLGDMAGTQTYGGKRMASLKEGTSKVYSEAGSFGQGGGAINLRMPGGGGGYYGGASGSRIGGSGGSGYIGNTLLTNKEMYCYQCTESNDTDTKTVSTDNYSTDPVPQYAKEGNGYAKITITRKIEDGSEYDFDFTGDEKTFSAPYTGEYQLETWGAQGGNVRIYTGGYGGYSKGLIKLGKNQNLYINVGGQGIGTDGDLEGPGAGGYNGGGTSSSKNSGDAGSGGGATHIALETGLLNTFENKRDKLLIVSGGGGGSAGYNWSASNYGANGGSGGGFNGVNTPGKSAISASYGGTQDSGGVITNTTTSSILTTTSGTFGLGGSGSTNFGSASGGGGYYGGSGCYTPQGYGACGGGGGSGYIGNSLLYDKAMYCYKCDESSATSTRTITTNSHSILAKQNIAKEGNGFSRITLLKRTINQTKLTLDFTFEEYVNGNEYTFGYTGTEQTFTVPKTGYYKLETWGAEGSTYVNGIGGYGGHSFGTIKLIKGEKLYINVGGKSRDKPYGEGKVVEGGYNGGGSSGDSGGGGATHISTLSGILSELEDNKDSIIIVAGGGGGGERTAGGSGGGYIGNTGSYGYNNAHLSGATGGTQNAGGVGSVSNPEAAEHTQHGDGESGSFGQGANSCMSDTCGAGAGGGGYYGGGSSHYASGGGGGSGYIANGYLTDKAMYCYNCQESNEESTKTVSTTDVSSDPISNNAKSGDGFAKITLVEEIPEYTFDYTGDVQEFIAPYKGIYKVELWGAQGGHYDETYYGGNGGYTEGTITLNKSEKLYLYVGGSGSCGLGEGPILYGGYNGGGDANNEDIVWQGRTFCSGGGATDVRLINGTWDNFNSLKSRIMVAGAGGGASYLGSNYHSNGGHSGGLYGNESSGISKNNPVFAEGGTQWQGFGFGIGSVGMTATNGGGSGYFGGQAGPWAGGAGGSSYISGHPGCVSIKQTSTSDNITFINDSNDVACNDSTSSGYNSSGYNTDAKCSIHYSEKAFTDTLMIDGQGYSWNENGVGNNVVGMPTHDGRTTMIGNTGNGYAKITLVEKIDTYNISYDLDGGTLKNKRNTYSTFDDDITLGTPIKEGYTFTGWTGGKNMYQPIRSYKGINIPLHDGTVVIDGDTFVFTTTGGDLYYGPGSINDSTPWTSGANGQLMEIDSTKHKKVSYYLSNDTFRKNYFCFYDENYQKIGYRAVSSSQGTVEVPTNTKYVMFRFGCGANGVNSSSNEIGVTISTKVMVTCDDIVTTYEPFIIEPTYNLTIPSRSIGNRTYIANWTKVNDLNVRYNWNYNMVKNGDFTQTGDDFGWYAVNGATVNVDDTVLYNGQPSYHIYSSTADWSGADTEFVDVEDGYPPCGHNYNFSISVYKDSTHELGDVNQYIRLYFTYHANDTGTYYPGITDSTIMDGLIDGQWVTYSKDVVIPYAEDYSQNGVFRLDCNKNKVTNNFWVGDVNLKIVDKDTKAYNSTISTLPTPTRYGYTFKGWYTQPSGGTKINKGYVVTEDIEMYAHWQKNS